VLKPLCRVIRSTGLPKKGTVSIDLQNEADVKWEVTYNIKHGQAGPLAYKVDTLIINRCIDEMGRPLPELIRIGSLSDICRALGTSDTGPNITDLRRAFMQNASAFINAKIRVKLKSGKEKWDEIGYTRYSMIFTGESLPDGSQADAVYIILNPPYRELLNRVELRPLDYDYLKELAPGAQRFYELLSFQVYGAIASRRPRAKLLYSDYCKYAPQTRYHDFDHVKKQMYKLHAPHRASGYIVKVDYRNTSDSLGKPDWEMLYTPGTRALDEFQAFTNRHIRQQSPVLLPPFTVEKPNREAVQASLDLSDSDSNLAAELIRRGISDKITRNLVAALKPGQELMDQLEYYDYLKAGDARGRITSPTGLLVTIIRDNTSVPDEFPTARKRRLCQEGQHADLAAQAQKVRLDLSYEEYQTAEVNRYINEVLSPEEFRLMFEQIRLSQKRAFKQMTPAQLDELARRKLHVELQQSGRAPMLSFEEFCRKTDHY